MNTNSCSERKHTEVQFQDADLALAEYLTQLALDSNAFYSYRTVSDKEAEKVFLVKEEHFKRGIIRLMKVCDEIIGFFGIYHEEKEGKTTNCLSHLFLHPDFIGKGYGKLLFQEAMRAAEQELCWEGVIWESDPHAADFYRKMGARKIGDNPCILNPSFRSPVFIYVIGNAVY